MIFSDFCRRIRKIFRAALCGEKSPVYGGYNLCNILIVSARRNICDYNL